VSFFYFFHYSGGFFFGERFARPVAEAVVGKTGNDVKMGVRHNLAGGAVIVHYYIYPVGINPVFYGDGYFFDKRSDVFQNFIGQIVNFFIMFFRYDKRMAEIDRLNV